MQKKKLFLITGMMRSMCNWKNAIDILSADMHDFDIIPLDVPGMGEYYKDKSPLSIEEYVTFLKVKFDQNKGEVNYMLGFSLGGMITSKWTQMYPNDLSGVVLVTTSFSHLQNPLYRLRPSNLLATGFALITTGKLREKLLFSAICNNKENKHQVLDEWVKDQEKFPVQSKNVIRQMIAGFLFKSKAIKLDIPALVLVAPNDKLVSYKCSMNIAQKYNTETQVHETAGHDLVNDDPRWVVKKLTEWIKKIE